MARVTAKFKVCRRLGEGVYTKCGSTKYAIAEPKKRMAQMKGKRRKGLTEYGTQLLEKQRVRFTYGITEKQLSNYVADAKEKKSGTPMEWVFKSLEGRLDNVVFRLGFCPSRAFAKQLVSHGHMMVNGKRVNVPSYRLKIGDTVSIRPASRNKPVFSLLLDGEDKDFTDCPSWISFDKKNMVATIKSEPTIGEYDTHLNFGTLIEYYSRV